MTKKKKSANTTAKATKKLKAAQKVERKEQKNIKKSKGKARDDDDEDEDDDDDQDLEGILEKMRKDWEQAHTVTEELVEGPPSKRANATLTACPNGNHLWCIGGEFFSDEGKAYFYNDVFRYSPEKNEWRKFISPTCPGPRSAHAVVASPTGGGKIFLFGGEFSSLHQTTFHHYRDFWVFDISTHSWDRIETKIRPSARSGHRMAIFKHYIVLFGGFYDPGVTTRYLNDLWVFDTQEYRWREIEFRESESRPSPRSGFSFLPTPDGILLHGGYCKEYSKGKRPIGVMLEDTWFLHMSIPSTVTPTSTSTTTTSTYTSSSSKSKTNTKTSSSSSSSSSTSLLLTLKWERRKRPSYAPSTRSGCTMTLWSNKMTGILFGGVTDEDRNEETLESVFWNELFGYQMGGGVAGGAGGHGHGHGKGGRWVLMGLRKAKGKKQKRGGGGARKKGGGGGGGGSKRVNQLDEDESEESGSGSGSDEDTEDKGKGGGKSASALAATSASTDRDVDPDDPNLTTPLPRYNAMLAVLRNTLYIYGGIYEKGSREYTLDDFYSLQLDKMDRYVCLKESEVVIADGDVSSSSSDGDDDDDDDDDNGDGEDDDEGGEGGDSDEENAEDGVGDDENNAGSVVGKRESLAKPDDEDDGTRDNNKSHVLDTTVSSDTDLRRKALAFMQSSKDPKSTHPQSEPASTQNDTAMSTPLPGETLAMFYARSREHWTQKAHGASDNRGKQLRKDGFELAKERYASYKPILEEVEKILQEAGLDEEEMKRSAIVSGAGSGGVGQSRNRR